MPSVENPNSNKNLRGRQWVKGQSGNPSGRTKESFGLMKCLYAFADQRLNGFRYRKWFPDAPEDLTADQAVALMLYYKAGVEGSMKAAELLLERRYGKVKDTVEITHRTPEQERDDIAWALKVLNEDVHKSVQ